MVGKAMRGGVLAVRGLPILGLALLVAGCASQQPSVDVQADPGQNLAIGRVVKVYRGDLFKADLQSSHPTLGRQVFVQIAGISCREIKPPSCSSCTGALFCDPGAEARKFALATLKDARRISLHNIHRNDSQRLYALDQTPFVVADVEVDGRDLASVLIQAGCAEVCN